PTGRTACRCALPGVARTAGEGEEEIRAPTRRTRLGAGLGDIEFDERQTRLMAGLDGRLEPLRPGLLQTVIAADVTADGHRSGGQLGGDGEHGVRARLRPGRARAARDPRLQVEGLEPSVSPAGGWEGITSRPCAIASARVSPFESAIPTCRSTVSLGCLV